MWIIYGIIMTGSVVGGTSSYLNFKLQHKWYTGTMQCDPPLTSTLSSPPTLEKVPGELVQSINIFDDVYEFGTKCNLLDQGYDDRRESVYPIEEMLETFDTTALSMALSGTLMGPKDLSRHIVSELTELSSTTNVDYTDKFIDNIIYSLGSLYKLGFNPVNVQLAINIVTQANLQKVNAGVDDHGKQLKPANWEQYVPESKLKQLMLDNNINT